ncbi:MAG: GGDEF domain-containing protein [Sandaracinus sp.]|nr:GGDEF domain-containing protein [Sandaracinus sp.]
MTLPSRQPEHALRVLVDLTRALTEAEIGLEAALKLVTDAAVELFAASHASLRILDDSGEQLLSGARSGAGSHAAPVRFRRGEGVAGWVIEHGEVARVDDIGNDPRFVQIEGQGFEMASLLCVPLFSAGKVVGCLALSADHHAHFSEEDEILGRLLANCAVPPLERARLQRLAITDALTGSLRQSQLAPVLDQAMRGALVHRGALSIVAIDLDHFKAVNDRFGHLVGDEVLRSFGRRLRQLVRGEDVVVRRGGEEFVVVLPGCDVEGRQDRGRTGAPRSGPGADRARGRALDRATRVVRRGAVGRRRRREGVRASGRRSALPSQTAGSRPRRDGLNWGGSGRGTLCLGVEPVILSRAWNRAVRCRVGRGEIRPLRVLVSK